VDTKNPEKSDSVLRKYADADEIPGLEDESDEDDDDDDVQLVSKIIKYFILSASEFDIFFKL